MGKRDGELWDDSALIDAFEDAISSYKMMHGIKQIDDDLKDAVRIGYIKSEVIAGEEDVKSCVDGTVSEADASSNSLEEATLLTKDKEVNEAVPNGTLELETDLNVLPGADYNSLVNQYYELQEKLQVTWQQLQQFGYSTDQCLQYTTEVGLSESTAVVKEASNLPSDHIGATQMKQNNYVVGRKSEPCQQFLSCGHLDDLCFSSDGVPGAVSKCRGRGQSTTDSGSRLIYGCCDYPCTSECVVYSSCTASACRPFSDAVPGYDPEKSLNFEDNHPIRLAVQAAEKAVSSIKIQTADQLEGSGQISIDSLAKSPENNGCDTDLSTVLNAWFSAGLATGKYLAEQSNSRRQKG